MQHAHTAPVVALVLLVLVPFWPLTTMQGVVITDDIFTSDLMNDAFPSRFFLGEALKGGELPLWYPPVYGGFPLLARPEAGVCYPPNLLLFGLLPPYAALNVTMLLTLVVAAVGMYLFARRIVASTPAAMLAAVAIAYSGFLISHLKHLSMVNVACWLPLGLWCIERCRRCADAGDGPAARRSLVWLGGVMALQVLAGHVQIAYYSGLVYGAYFVARFLGTRSARTSAQSAPGSDPIGVAPRA
ncbi:MAG: hypothetical protein ACT4PE_09905, partial [Candidatus Eiseniibacteriota bacterium]